MRGSGTGGEDVTMGEDKGLCQHQLQQKGFINNPEMSDVIFLIGHEKIYAHRYN